MGQELGECLDSAGRGPDTHDWKARSGAACRGGGEPLRAFSGLSRPNPPVCGHPPGPHGNACTNGTRRGQNFCPQTAPRRPAGAHDGAQRITRRDRLGLGLKNGGAVRLRDCRLILALVRRRYGNTERSSRKSLFQHEISVSLPTRLSRALFRRKRGPSTITGGHGDTIAGGLRPRKNLRLLRTARPHYVLPNGALRGASPHVGCDGSLCFARRSRRSSRQEFSGDWVN